MSSAHSPNWHGPPRGPYGGDDHKERGEAPASPVGVPDSIPDMDNKKH